MRRVSVGASLYEFENTLMASEHGSDMQRGHTEIVRPFWCVGLCVGWYVNVEYERWVRVAVMGYVSE